MLLFTHFHLCQWQLIFRLLANLCSAALVSTPVTSIAAARRILFMGFSSVIRISFSFRWKFHFIFSKVPSWDFLLRMWMMGTRFKHCTIAIFSRCLFTGLKLDKLWINKVCATHTQTQTNVLIQTADFGRGWINQQIMLANGMEKNFQKTELCSSF